MHKTAPEIRSVLIDEHLHEHPRIEILIESFPQAQLIWIAHDETLLRLQGLHPASITHSARREVLITRNAGSFFKSLDPAPGMRDPEREGHFRLEMFQGCPGHCIYCFCRTYLQCRHPVIFINIEDAQRPIDCDSGSKTVITGDVADSLALGAASSIMHQIAAEQFPDFHFELRSKFSLPSKFEMLNPKQFRLDWSLAPDEWVKSNEPGTASLNERLFAIHKAIKHGFPVGLRLDPIQSYHGADFSYMDLIRTIKRLFRGWKPVEFTLGSYKLCSELKAHIRQQSPRSKINAIEWILGEDSKYRPARSLRIPAYRRLIDQIDSSFPGVDIQLSMEPEWVWALFPRCRATHNKPSC